MLCRGRPLYNSSAVFELRGRTTRNHPQEARFTHPPQWIHESLAAKVFLGKESPLLISRRREAKRRALLQMLDRIPVRAERPTSITKPAASLAEVPLPRPLPGGQNRLQK